MLLKITYLYTAFIFHLFQLMLGIYVQAAYNIWQIYLLIEFIV